MPQPKPQMEMAAYEPPQRDVVISRTRGAKLRRPEASAEMTVAPATALNNADWTIQIGAYGDVTSAKTELASYAERATDVLGQAARIVSPMQSPQGHVLYRARFGPFAEHDARAVCQILTERGQTCFAALASR